MLFHAMFQDEALESLKQVQQAEIAIGLPTDRLKPPQATQAVKQIISGLQKHYPHKRVIIINADTGRNPDTRQAIRALATDNIMIISGRYDGRRGRGAAVCAIVDAALHLNAQAIAFLDCRTKSIEPDWVPGLLMPILNQQADLVKPRYYWPLPEGALSDLLFYPFTRAVWGLNVRHPGAEDFALSPTFALDILNQDVWYTEVNQYGIDIWVNTFAITEKRQVGQSAIGLKRTSSKKLGKRATSIFIDAVGTMLRQIHLRSNIWPKTNVITPVPTLTSFAPDINVGVVPQTDTSYLIEALALGWIEYRNLWQKVMRPEHLTAVERLASRSNRRFYFPSDLWAKIVYDFAVVYNKGDCDPNAVVAALYPLYLGRLASFWPEIAGLTIIGREGTVSAQAVEFEENLDYLKARWENYE